MKHAQRRRPTVRRNATKKLSISLPNDIAAWLRRANAKRGKPGVSFLIKEALLPAFDARHAKP